MEFFDHVSDSLEAPGQTFPTSGTAKGTSAVGVPFVVTLRFRFGSELCQGNTQRGINYRKASMILFDFIVLMACKHNLSGKPMSDEEMEEWGRGMEESHSW